MNEWIVRFDKEQGEDVAVGELIRCKDCKFYWSENHVCAEIGADDGVCHVHVSDDDYCSAAERKEE